ncbi:MAG: type II toxin-antitoxin system VapC family toxin [Saprospiraceae bacterium]
MNLLIDTQSLIWFYENNPALSRDARRAIEDGDNICFASMASFWEMSIKMNLGKLEIKDCSLDEFIQEVEEHGFITFEISKTHILQNGILPFHHRDPFDRIIIAQVLVEDFTIVSIDQVFDSYGVKRIW